MIRSRLLWPSIACAALALAATFAWFHVRTERQRQMAARGVPVRPALESASAGLREAVAAAEQAIYDRTAPLDALAQLATLYHANGFYPEAQHAYRTLCDARPHEPVWPHRAAHLHAALGELPEAIVLWRRVAELAPDYLPARIGLGDALLKSGEYDAAKSIFADALRRDPANVHAQFGLARIDIANTDWTPARDKLERIAQQTDGLLGADLLATVYERTGAPERGAALRARQKSHGMYVSIADPWIDELMDACYDSYRLALESGTAAVRQDFARAERLIQRALEIAPNDANLNFHAGAQAEQRGALEQARAHLETAVRLDPRLSDAWAALVRLQLKQGPSQGAWRTLNTALAANPDSPVLLMERARYHKAQGHTDAAMADFRRVTRLRRDEALAFIELAGLLFSAGRIDDGIQTLEQGLVAEPGQPVALAALAFAAIHAGRNEPAERALREIVDQPRVPAAERARLFGAYKQKFGRSFSWAP